MLAADCSPHHRVKARGTPDVERQSGSRPLPGDNSGLGTGMVLGANGAALAGSGLLALFLGAPALLVLATSASMGWLMIRSRTQPCPAQNCRPLNSSERGVSLGALPISALGVDGRSGAGWAFRASLRISACRTRVHRPGYMSVWLIRNHAVRLLAGESSATSRYPTAATRRSKST